MFGHFQPGKYVNLKVKDTIWYNPNIPINIQNYVKLSRSDSYLGVYIFNSQVCYHHPVFQYLYIHVLGYGTCI